MAQLAQCQSSPTIAPYVSTLFVTNIHCPSCVSYAEDILHLVSGVRKIDVSIVDHTIQVQHDARAEIGNAVAEELIRAAFEVRHLTTTDTSGRTVGENEFGADAHRSRSSPRWSPFMSKAQRKHIENCNACKATMSKMQKRHRIWSSLKRTGRAAAVSKESANVKSMESPTSETLVDNDKPTVIDIDGALRQEKNISSEYTASISVGGMTCASCTGTITRELQSMDVVVRVEVDLMGNNATVTYAAPASNIDKIVEAIEDVGYEATVVNVQGSSPDPSAARAEAAQIKFKTALSIDGMFCGSCVGTITRGVMELPFVSAINVDLVGNSAVVEYENEANLEEVIEKIGDLGYDATFIKSEQLGTAFGNEPPPTERTIQIQIDGMFCEHCPSNILTSLHNVYGTSIVISQQPTIRDPRLTITYKPSPPSLTARGLISTINETHDAFSASVYHPPSQEERSRAMKHREQKHLLLRLLFTFIVAIPTFIIGIVFMDLVPKSNPTRMWFEEPVLSGDATREEWALFFMTTPVMFFGADIFHTRSFKEIRALWRRNSPTPILRRFYRFGSMNLLISAGTSVAYFSSLAVLILDATSNPGQSGRGSDTYFDSVTFLSFFILIGRFLEAYSKAKTGDAVALLTNLRPSEAFLVENDSDERTSTQKVSVDLLEVGDIVNIPHGTSPPTDGAVDQDGTFLFDESSLTGESKPVKKVAGDKVFTGSVNISQPVKIRVTEIGGKSMLDQIVDVVRKGQSKRAPIERVADIITGYFVPVITVIAITTWVVWLGLGQSGSLPQDWLDVKRGGWPFWSLEFAIAVFVVACPCGIGLAAPTALYVGGGLAAKYGILVQGGGEAFQEASKLEVIVFDKTGTLTEGQMKVTDHEFLDMEVCSEQDQAIAFALSRLMEESSTHPIAKAITDFCAERGEHLPVVDVENASIKEVPGQGMTGKFQIKLAKGESDHEPSSATFEAAIGNQRLLSTIKTDEQTDQNQDYYLEPLLTKYQNLGRSTSIFAIRQVPASELTDVKSIPFRPTCLFAIADPLRATTASVINTLQQEERLEVHMCTGDNLTTARAIASQVGIAASNIRAGVLPQDKAAYIQELQSGKDGKRRIVAFVGDGTNDTPALSAADVSIALSSGSDVAVGTASFILLNSDLETILKLVKLSKRVFRRVKMNFAWAGVYNICLIPIAAGVTYAAGGWRLGPVWASAAMAASSVSVVLSSLALRIEGRKPTRGGRSGGE